MYLLRMGTFFDNHNIITTPKKSNIYTIIMNYYAVHIQISQLPNNFLRACFFLFPNQDSTKDYTLHLIVKCPLISHNPLLVIFPLSRHWQFVRIQANSLVEVSTSGISRLFILTISGKSTTQVVLCASYRFTAGDMCPF